MQQENGRVAGLFIATGRGARMQAKDQVLAEAGRGLVGDRYHAGIGTFSQRFEVTPGARALSLIDTGAIVRCEQRLGHRLEPGALRRNLVIDGLDLMRLSGARLRVGAVEIELVGACPPCGYLARLLQTDMQRGLRGIGGMRA